MQGTCVWSLGQEDGPEREMATCSSILAQNIPWTKEPGRPTVPTGVTESDLTEVMARVHTAWRWPSSQAQYFHDDKVLGSFFRDGHLNTPILTPYRWKSSQDWNCLHPSSNPRPSKAGKKRVCICPLLWVLSLSAHRVQGTCSFAPSPGFMSTACAPGCLSQAFQGNHAHGFHPFAWRSSGGVLLLFTLWQIPPAFFCLLW